MRNPFKNFINKKIDSRAREIGEQLSGKSIQKIKAQVGYSTGSSTRDYSGGRSGGAKYPHGLSASGSPRILNHRTLRRNARDAYHDTPQAKALVERFADTVADIGLMLEAVPKADILGIDVETAEEWAKNVESRFDLWCRDKKQHRSETITFYQSQRKYQIFQHRDNDMFTRLYYSPDKDLQNPLQFEFIDPDQIRGDAYTTNYGVQSNIDGIERDARGREKSYKIWIPSKNKPGEYQDITINRIGPKSKRIFMLHGFDAVYAGQGRGYSRLAFALQEFENITDFSLAQIKKAINQSNLTMYVKPSKDNPSSNPFEDIAKSPGAGPIPSRIATDDPTTEELNTTGLPVNYCPIPEATVGVPGSTGVFNLMEGEDLKSFDNTAPSDSFDSFVNAFTSYLAAGSGMPIEVLLMKFNANYSASRASLILFWRIAQIWREEMAADYLNPIYYMWISEEIAAGRIIAPGFSDPRLRAAWLNNRWIGSPMPNIDPMRTAAADKLYVELGAQTLDRTARNLNGSDGQSNRAKLAREFDELPNAPWNEKEGPEDPDEKKEDD